MKRGVNNSHDSRRFYDWLSKATEDLLAATLLMEDERTAKQAVFHCQQLSLIHIWFDGACLDGQICTGKHRKTSLFLINLKGISRNPLHFTGRNANITCTVTSVRRRCEYAKYQISKKTRQSE